MRLRNVSAVMLAVGMVLAAGAADARSSTMSRTEVQHVQRALNSAGYDVRVDGKWGPSTQRALREYQQAHGLTATGRPDRDTLAALDTGSQRRMSGSSGARLDQSPTAGGSAGINHMGNSGKGSRTRTDTLTNPSTVYPAPQ
ncbi:peptidoglycan-binding domain-containing protein [Azospirillum sp. sgz302134]